MKAPARSFSRCARHALVGLLSITAVGCTTAVLPGASGVDDPVAQASGEAFESLATPSKSPAFAGAESVALPDELRRLVEQIPSLQVVDGRGIVTRLDQEPVSFPTSADAFWLPDYYDTGSYLTVLEMTTEGWDVREVDLATGALRLIVQLERDGQLAVSRRRSGDVLLAGSIGVDLITVDTGERRKLIEPVLPPGLEGPTERAFEWSPSGRTAVARLCTIDVCIVDIIDARDWTVRRLPGEYTLLAVTDEHAIYYPSLDDRRPRLLDLTTLESRLVAPQIAALLDAYAREDGGFVLYGVTSWRPEVHPVHRPLVLVDPTTMTDRVLVDQGPDDWAYPYFDWTSNDWVLLIPELGIGGKPGLRIAIDTRTGERFEYTVDPVVESASP